MQVFNDLQWAAIYMIVYVVVNSFISGNFYFSFVFVYGNVNEVETEGK